MRGKVISTGVASVKIRITPAYAGKRYGICWNKLVYQDHPRLCGEKIQKKVKILQFLGSPPPMRGKDAVCIFCMFSCGITPAYAGKSIRLSSYGQGDWDHPRLCGEKARQVLKLDKEEGSPPPMRGKAQCPYKPHGACGITPAYAGKRVYAMIAQDHVQDHPRLCGEKKMNCPKCGSDNGITPAYAGKRKPPTFGVSRCRDHPRLCGEKKNLLY